MRRPDRAVSEAERAEVVNCAYLLYLQLYLLHFGKLSPRECRALTLIEVEGVSYRAAAADLGIRLENLKMVIFRARRKIHRSMRRVFDGMSPDCRPARDPRNIERVSKRDALNSGRLAAPEESQ